MKIIELEVMYQTQYLLQEQYIRYVMIPNQCLEERQKVFMSETVLANGYGSEELGSVVTCAGAAGIHNSVTVGTYLPCAEH